MSESQNEDPLHYTLRQLHDDTAGVIESINRQERPAVITRMGRFIAYIQPLACVENLEGQAIQAAIESGRLDLNPTSDKSYTSEEMLEALLRDNADRIRESIRHDEDPEVIEETQRVGKGGGVTLSNIASQSLNDDSTT